MTKRLRSFLREAEEDGFGTYMSQPHRYGENARFFGGIQGKNACYFPHLIIS